jgi:hypothetical protein
MLGHSIGLSDSYYRPDANEILEEYLKAVNLLNINEENRLKKKVQQLTIRSDKLNDLHDEVKHLRSRSERFDEFLVHLRSPSQNIIIHNNRTREFFRNLVCYVSVSSCWMLYFNIVYLRLLRFKMNMYL